MVDGDNQGQTQAPEETNREVAPQEETQQDTSREEAAGSSMPDGEKSADSLPEDAPDRTREQFEKLKDSNKKLKEQLDQLQQGSQRKQEYESVFDSLRPKQASNEQGVDVGGTQYQNLSQGQAQNIVNKFVDEQGNVDINGLNQALVTANQRAANAEQKVERIAQEFSQYSETQQTREAYQEYPQLNPENEKFDPQFYDLVRDRLLRNMYEGKKQPLREVSAQIAKAYKTEQAEPKQDTQKEVKQTAGPVEQGRGANRQTTADLDDLRERTRRSGVFDNDALSERLNAYFGTQNRDN